MVGYSCVIEQKFFNFFLAKKQVIRTTSITNFIDAYYCLPKELSHSVLRPII